MVAESTLHVNDLLPEDFVPNVNHVIIGRGKKCYDHSGNERLREIVDSRLDEYSQAASKSQKSMIIGEIVLEIQETLPDGAFVREIKETGRWCKIDDFLAREKTSQAFRNALHEKYKSSKESKKKRRREEMVKKTTPDCSKRTRYDRFFEEELQDKDSLALLFGSEMEGESFFGEVDAYEKDSQVFSLLSAFSSPMINEQDDSPFEPTPMFEPMAIKQNVTSFIRSFKSMSDNYVDFQTSAPSMPFVPVQETRSARTA